MPNIVVAISPESEATCRGCNLLRAAIPAYNIPFSCNAGMRIELVDKWLVPVRPKSCLTKVEEAALLERQALAKTDPP